MECKRSELPAAQVYERAARFERVADRGPTRHQYSRRAQAAATRPPWYICTFLAASHQRVRTMSSYEYIKQLLVEKHDVKPEVISPDAKLTELGLDSLSIAELMFDVSDKYGIDIPDERANFTTLGEGAALVDELVQAKGA